MESLSKKLIIPILLCGGSGTRLWPLSRSSFPKQYLRINPLNKNSFLQETQYRLKNIDYVDDPILICNTEQRFITAEQMREINVKPKSIILEPIGRNTAPAIAIGILKALEINSDPLLLILPADHAIENKDKFIESIQSGVEYAIKGNIVTFGVPPHSPETGFGYIEAENKMNFNKLKAENIRRFLEKPDKKTAETLISNKKYSWNSGIFLARAKVALNEFKKLNPDILSLARDSLNESVYDLDFQRLKEDSFKKFPNISFDIAIMEKTKLGKVIPLDVGWSDVGNWESFWSISKKDKNGNVVSGNVFIENTNNCLLHSENRLVVGLGIDDLVVVETSDAILVTNKTSSQSVKNLVNKLNKLNYLEAKKHKKIFRPWGNYQSISEDLGWQVKRITVNPGESLSLQKHKFRTEHWIIVSGIAEVEIGEKKKTLKQNQSTYIPLGKKHRLSNPGKNDLILIEVQSGTYLGEDDIIRYEDNYGRIKGK